VIWGAPRVASAASPGLSSKGDAALLRRSTWFARAYRGSIPASPCAVAGRHIEHSEPRRRKRGA